MKAINNFLVPRLFSEKYIEGTLAFKNNHGALLSQSIYWSFVAATLVASLLISLFRRVIKEDYARATKIMFMQKVLFWRLFGILSLLGILARIGIVIYTDYAFKFEVLPLHFCRLMVIFLSIAMIINRPDLIKYFGFLSVFGAISALFVPSMGEYSGADSFWFWDYLLLHVYSFIVPFILFAISKFEYTFKTTVETIAFFVVLCLVMFGLNFALDTYAKDPSWKSNYWYLGLNENNDLYEKFGKVMAWPTHILLFIFLGIVLTVLFVAIWALFVKLHIVKVEGKIKAYTTRSEFWASYKESMKQFFKKDKKPKKDEFATSTN
ncbi:hypothetical protein E5287_02890 [Mycoplasmopsis agalactiae]|uniref:Integral membrane protein (Intg_mem_TP0381) n=1 Tax=Mycoplasmopsis agalactiae (strain NCTC 10123 / CIP 59.7 / PG2) TaxID=347257 RepID=A5IZ22_MYCAP|nr:YwaF family protein [Mycoplasmopsis agalactiae]QYR08744.1 hypothetical protein E5287_02890 [Mycoplasmopsis agalactiae]CAL59281.1 Conserved hypothetical protein [Mycoplasmopsis agalactiae PG2]